MLSEYKQDEYFFIDMHYINLAVISWRNWKIKLIREIVIITIAITIIIIIIAIITINLHINLQKLFAIIIIDITVIINPSLKYMILNEMIIYKKPNAVDKFI